MHRGFIQLPSALLIGAALMIAVGGVVFFAVGNDSPEMKTELIDANNFIQEPAKHKTGETSIEEASQPKETREEESAGVPKNLSLPFSTSDIDGQNGQVNPFGVVRFSADLGRYGHSGIDIPLREGSNIYAVADGAIVLIKSAEDPWGGRGIYQLLQQTKKGEGWGFIYEHVKPANGIEEGSVVERGQLIATKIAPEGFTAHFQMSYHFNDYQYTNDIQCWPNFLSAEDKNILENWWDAYRKSTHLLSSWESTFEEGKYGFKGLLDSSAYPGGARLCYSLGTDVR